jgi:hypothetical protein
MSRDNWVGAISRKPGLIIVLILSADFAGQRRLFLAFLNLRKSADDHFPCIKPGFQALPGVDSKIFAELFLKSDRFAYLSTNPVHRRMFMC